jgi:hypothetical protein
MRLGINSHQHPFDEQFFRRQYFNVPVERRQRPAGEVTAPE